MSSHDESERGRSTRPRRVSFGNENEAVETDVAPAEHTPRSRLSSTSPSSVSSSGGDGRRIFIVRDCERLDMVVGRQWGETARFPYDTPLSELGYQQAEELAAFLQKQKIAHVFVSPFRRTRETATPFCQSVNQPMILEWGLAESMHADQWVWYSRNRMFVDNPNVVSLEEESPEKEMRELVEIGEIENHFFAGPMMCPESEAHITQRVRAVVDSLELLEGNILLVTHGQTGRTVTEVLLEEEEVDADLSDGGSSGGGSRHSSRRGSRDSTFPQTSLDVACLAELRRIGDGKYELLRYNYADYLTYRSTQHKETGNHEPEKEFHVV